MSGMLGLLPVVGDAVEGICGLGLNLVKGVAGPDGLFGRTLNAVCAANPYQDDGVAPGDRAAALEAHLVRLEKLVAERTESLLKQTAVLDASDKLTRIAEVLQGVSLDAEEREAVLARVIAFLSNKSIAERLGTDVPVPGELIEQLDRMLEEFGVLEHERLPMLQQVDDILNGVEERTAA